MLVYTQYLKAFSLILLTLSCTTYTMDSSTLPTLHTIIAPGHNGEAFGNDVIYEGYRAIKFKASATRSKRDLGQNKSIKWFEKQWQKTLKENSKSQENDKYILAGVSEGAATVLNWLAGKSKQEQEQKVAAIILKSALANGNDTIIHAVEGEPKAVLSDPYESLSVRACALATYAATYLPFARFWVPVAIMGLLPSYRPWGSQATSSIKKVSSAIPLIIIHDCNDHQMPISGAERLYCTAHEQGNKNAFLFRMECQCGAHYDTVRNSPSYKDLNRENKLAALHAIYKKYNLPYDESLIGNSEPSLTVYQPDVVSVKQSIYERTKYKRWLRNTIDSATIAALGALGAWYLSKK